MLHILQSIVVLKFCTKYVNADMRLHLALRSSMSTLRLKRLYTLVHENEIRIKLKRMYPEFIRNRYRGTHGG